MKKLEQKKLEMVKGGSWPFLGIYCVANWLAFLGASNTIEERYFFNEYATYCIN
jgi:hypothetical protein